MQIYFKGKIDNNWDCLALLRICDLQVAKNLCLTWYRAAYTIQGWKAHATETAIESGQSLLFLNIICTRLSERLHVPLFAPLTRSAHVSLSRRCAGATPPFLTSERGEGRISGMPTSVLARVLFKAVSTGRKALSSACQKHCFSTNRTEEASAWGSKKSNRSVKLNFNLAIMADPKIEQILAPLRASVKEQVCVFFLHVVSSMASFRQPYRTEMPLIFSLHLTLRACGIAFSQMHPR